MPEGQPGFGYFLTLEEAQDFARKYWEEELEIAEATVKEAKQRLRELRRRP